MARFLLMALVAILLVPTSPHDARSTPVQVREDVVATKLLDEATDVLDRPARLRVVDVPVAAALTRLRYSAGVSLAFSPSLLPEQHATTCRCRSTTVAEALERILAGTGLRYLTYGEHVLIAPVLDPPLNSLDRPVELALAVGTPLAPREADRLPTVPQTGQITGRVVDAETLSPMPSVQIFIPGLEIGTLTTGDGRFLLTDVPAGTHEVHAQRLGYGSAVREVAVESEQTVEVNFELSEEALALDEIVVTGTPGGTERRAVGNVVAQVDAAEIAEVAPVGTFQEMLSGREAGVSFQRSSGNVGTGAAIRIRGYTSMGVGNQPLIYVDGIRVDNRAAVGPELRDGAQVSKMDDINPEDIESIEVIKGPAAATLYGTEASNGVIQIITKQGSSGEPQFDLTVRQGANWLMNPREKVGRAYATDPETGEIVDFNIWEQEKAAGRPFFTTGHSQSYNLSMRGGTDAVRYYLSSDWEDATGIVPYNWDKKLNLRANVSVVPHEALSLDVSTGYLNGTTRFMQQRTAWGIWEQAQWATPLGRDTELRGFLRARPEAIDDIEATRDNSRFIGSATVNFNPTDWFTHRLVLGLDVAHEENRVLFPRHPNGTDHDFGGLSLGDLTIDRPATTYTTLDYATSAEYQLNEDISFTSSFGVQYYAKRLETVFSEGRIFPAPPITSLEGAAVSTSSEQIIENKTLGGYLQEQISYQDRIFLTGAVRGDDNSAFGAQYDAAIYPKLSATWVLSDEAFWAWDDVVNSFRLRSAWGKAGQQPDVFAAARLYQPQVGPDDASVVSPAEVGNPELGPEVSTELEVGFDAALFNDRASMELTYYTQEVEDALVSLPVPPSRGFSGSQQQNVGLVSNWGWEMALNGRFYQSDNVAWDVGASVGYTQNRIEDMGGRPPTDTFREGFPFPAIFDPVVLSAEIDPETDRVTNVMCDGGTGTNGWEPGGEPVPCSGGDAPRVLIGPGFAPWTMSYNTSVTLFRNLRLYAMVDHRIGRYQFAWDVGCRHTCFQTSLAANERTDPIFLAYAESGISSGMLGNFNAGFAKLRELSASYTLPDAFVARAGLSRASINIAGRNLWTMWVAQEDVFGAPVPDPEIRRANDISTTSNSNVPPSSSFSVTMRLSF